MHTIEHTYRHGVDAVFAKLTDPDHLKRRAEAAGHANVDVDVQSTDGGTKIRLARDITSEIPSFAKKFVDPTNRVVDELTWRDDGDGKKADFQVQVNKRISLKGTLTLQPTDGGCEFTNRYEAKVDVPLVGKKIAGIVEDKTEEGVRDDCAFTAKELG